VPHRGSVVLVVSAGLLLQAAAIPRPCSASSVLPLGPSTPIPSDARRSGPLRAAAVMARRAAGRANAMQTAGTSDGAIYGTVTDSTGASLPDVTVVISSDALIGDKGRREGMTNAEGVYRFGALPPGDYTLAFTREGFRTVERNGIHVGIGFTARIDIELEIAAVRQQVTVTPAAPVIDGKSTAVTVPFDAHVLANLPSSRSMFGILSATPGVQVGRFEVGGNKVYEFGDYKAYGRSRPSPMVEGIDVRFILAIGVPLNYGSFEEVSVLTAAHGAEWESAGVHAKFVVKSGGDQYHGTFYADYENRNWQAFNIDEVQTRLGGGGGVSARETNRLWSYHDINADVGGYLKRDRIWWYGSFREQDVAARQVNFPVAPFRADLTSYSAKGTVRLTENHTIVGFGHVGRNHQPYLLDPAAIYESEESTADQRGQGSVWKGESNSTIRNTMFLELRAGAFGSRRPETPNGTAPRFEDVGTLMIRGSALDWQEHLQRNQVLGSFSYVRDGWFGNHHVKAGGAIFRTTIGSRTRGYPGDVLHVLHNDVPIGVQLFQTPSAWASGLWEYGAYVEDSWRVTDRVTANVGLRFDRSRAFMPEQRHPAGRFNPRAQTFAAVGNLIDWNVIAPRIGLICDVTGGGRTIAKFSYGQYADYPGPLWFVGLNPNANDWIDFYAWSDNNGSGVWEPGEEGELIDSSGGVANESLDGRLRLPMVKEATAWIEHELPAGIGVRTGLVWRGERNHFASQDVNRPFEAFTNAVDVQDPGGDGRAGTGDDGPAIRVYQLGPDFLELPFVNVVRNVPGADSSYWTWEITANKRFDGRWSLVAGFDHTWNRSSVDALTPNDLINAPGGQHRFTTWNAKLYGTYAGPWDVLITPYLRHQSGEPFGRTFTAELAHDILEILAEPVGARRMDNVTLLDLRVEKGVRLPGDCRAAVFVDVYNLLNANPEENSNWSSGPSFLRPLDIVAPRIARVGVKLDW
jgi:hypothetical protein